MDVPLLLTGNKYLMSYVYVLAAHNVSIQNIKVSKCECHITYSVTKHKYVL
jgi:hypothetical protein